MKHRLCRKTAAAAMALLLVSGNLPVKPAADLLRTAVITAHAEDPAPTSGTCGENAVWELTENPKEAGVMIPGPADTASLSSKPKERLHTGRKA